MTSIFDCIIVGSGVAGMTSAIYLKRAGLKILLLEKSAPGGQINMSPKVENYPGLINIEGAMLAANIFEQIQNLDVEYKYGNVLSIKKDKEIFYIKTDLEEFTSKSVIIATGRKVAKLNLESEESLIGKGISYCVLCDANFFKDEIVSIFGNDYRTLEEAIYLSNICRNVNIICENEGFDSTSKLLLEKVNKCGNIKIYYNSSITKLNIIGQKLNSIEITTSKKQEEIDCVGLFISNHNEPELAYDNDIKCEENYIIVDAKMGTNIEGLYACGDIIKKEIYQLTTAVGEAAIAANSVLKYLGGN